MVLRKEVGSLCWGGVKPRELNSDLAHTKFFSYSIFLHFRS